ncbi:hypothetical protein SAMN02787118_101388 [Streptomyces mirabilis]|uniref:Phage integrase family protein n=1 Tax=Streptomyces mirabilis TaxID=68239 RepID=A0A1I1ZUP1_9ACTN|nr:hypothetical protein SAMN02787118_101388 [Streptomyces mirabilis]
MSCTSGWSVRLWLLPGPTREQGFHCLRHTFAGMRLDVRESVVSVSKWLGHADGHGRQAMDAWFTPPQSQLKKVSLAERGASDYLTPRKSAGQGLPLGGPQCQARDEVPLQEQEDQDRGQGDEDGARGQQVVVGEELAAEVVEG